MESWLNSGMGSYFDELMAKYTNGLIDGLFVKRMARWLDSLNVGWMN